MINSLPANAGDLRESGSIPGLGRNVNPLQYCLENPRDRGYSPWGHKELDTTEAT